MHQFLGFCRREGEGKERKFGKLGNLCQDKMMPELSQRHSLHLQNESIRKLEKLGKVRKLGKIGKLGNLSKIRKLRNFGQDEMLSELSELTLTHPVFYSVKRNPGTESLESSDRISFLPMLRAFRVLRAFQIFVNTPQYI